MFNKKTFKSIVAVFTASVMLFSTTAFAAKEKKTVTAVYNNIKIYVDNTRIIPKDANGTVVDPFIIDGTTYLPVRALANALGQGVSWNQETSTVTIEGEPDTTVNNAPTLSQQGKGKQTVETVAVYNDIKIVVDGSEITPKDVNGNIVEPFIIDGTTYLPVRALANALGEEVSWQQTTSSVFIGEQPFRLNSDILKQNADKTLLTVGNTPIKGSVFNFLAAQNCNDLSFPSFCDNYAPGKNLQELTIFSVPAPEYLVNYIAESIVPYYAVYNYAKENGFVDKPETKEVLDSIYANYRNQFDSDSEFNAFLAECGITAEDLESYIKMTSVASCFSNDLYSRYISIPYDESEILAVSRKNYVTAKHILVSDENTAKEIIKKLNNKSSFDDLSAEYNMDPGASPAGYTFTYGEMVAEFEEASFALKENTYTQTPIKSDYGYHVIMRLPLDEDWIFSNKSAIIERLAYNDTNKVINEITSNTKTTFTADYENYISAIK